jgi:hypothetical protein
MIHAKNNFVIYDFADFYSDFSANQGASASARNRPSSRRANPQPSSRLISISNVEYAGATFGFHGADDIIGTDCIRAAS